MSSRRLAGRTETFVRYGATDRLEFGFGYLWKQGIVRPLASYTLVTQRRDRPALTAGYFFDSLGGGREALFLSASRSLPRSLGVPASAYIGGARIAREDAPRFVAGVGAALSQRVNASVQYDGRFIHAGLVTRAGTVRSMPFFLGMVFSGHAALGPIGALDLDLRHQR